jgi:hypothetical protein
MNAPTLHTRELARLADLRRVDSTTAAAAHLCGLALDAGLVTLPALRVAVAGCRTRADLDGVLLALAADVFLAQQGEGVR